MDSPMGVFIIVTQPGDLGLLGLWNYYKGSFHIHYTRQAPWFSTSQAPTKMTTLFWYLLIFICLPICCLLNISVLFQVFLTSSYFVLNFILFLWAIVICLSHFAITFIINVNKVILIGVIFKLRVLLACSRKFLIKY